jgi:hypothetical protein
MRTLVAGLLVSTLLAGGGAARADETDQFLSWGIELNDSAEVLNAYFNREIHTIVDQRNRAIEPPCDCSSLALDTFDYLFKGRLTARLMDFIVHSDDIDVYPPRSISRARYQQMSVYRGLSFPYALPMGRTLRVGEIYFGDDKFGHFIGLGKRYYKHYLWYRSNGIPEDEAVRMAIEWGVLSENTVVGKVVDGIFSHGDLEANYQGFELARDMCEGDAPYFRRGEHGWEITRDMDLRDYVNPYWDESYNPSHYWGRRRSLVLPILRDEYAAKAEGTAVIARFHHYEKYPPSLSVEIIRQYFLDRGQTPQRDQVFAALGLRPGYPITLLASVPVP